MNDAGVTRRGFLQGAACTAAATLSTSAWAAASKSTDQASSSEKGALAQLSLAQASQRIAGGQTTSTALVEVVCSSASTSTTPS